MVSSPSRPRTSRRSDRRSWPSNVSPDGPAPTVICPVASTVSFGAWTIKPPGDTTVADSAVREEGNGNGPLARARPGFGPIGKLPGEIRIKRDNFTFYFPITTSILASVILSLLAWILFRK